MGQLHRAVVLRGLAVCIDSSGEFGVTQVWTSPMVGNDPWIMPSCSQASRLRKSLSELSVTYVICRVSWR